MAIIIVMLATKLLSETSPLIVILAKVTKERSPLIVMLQTKF